MATNMTDCNRLVQASQESGRQLHICHVLRYTGHIRLLRELVQSGVIGDVVDVDAPAVAVERPGDGRSVPCLRRKLPEGVWEEADVVRDVCDRFSATSASSAGRAATNA